MGSSSTVRRSRGRPTRVRLFGWSGEEVVKADGVPAISLVFDDEEMADAESDMRTSGDDGALPRRGSSVDSQKMDLA